jgi:hypothetical protein
MFCNSLHLTFVANQISFTMPANILTTDDLREFKLELLQEFKEMLFSSSTARVLETKRFLKTSEVLELLDLSHTSLQNLRNARVLPYSKINGTIFYDWNDIVLLIESNKKVAKPKLKRS